MFAVLCPNAKIGYTREERENIINKVETLPSQKKYEYKCDKCGAKVSANAKKCPKCGELFEED